MIMAKTKKAACTAGIIGLMVISKQCWSIMYTLSVMLGNLVHGGLVVTSSVKALAAKNGHRSPLTVYRLTVVALYMLSARAAQAFKY